MDEVQLAERLIAYDSSRRSGLRLAMDFVEGWLSSRDVPVSKREVGGRTCLTARVGSGPMRLVLHGHLDVVPGHEEQFSPVRTGGRLVGRGAYDMKGALAAMMLVVADLARGLEGLELELLIVPDEEEGTRGRIARRCWLPRACAPTS